MSVGIEMTCVPVGSMLRANAAVFSASLSAMTMVAPAAASTGATPGSSKRRYP